MQPIFVSSTLEEQLAARAAADGWSKSQAEWIGRLGARQSLDSPPSFDDAYRAGRLALSAGYFNDALNRGKSRLVAFLTVVDLEKQVAIRAGHAAPDYPDEWLQRAYVAVAHAADGGLSSAEQIEAGYAVLRAQHR